eukprot:Phypoly_transcript_01683.p1 GENE.Phypoly_transcript_01683~~Phypoly_transcript_01683.p1  ORF type:complete len:579 (-),score=69.05 Phypoly_transcript_01683:50-1786(-)
MFLESQYVFRAKMDKVTWAHFRVICFDEMAQCTAGIPFEQRYSHILSNCLPEHPIIIVGVRFLLKDAQSLAHILNRVVESGGEGVILRKAQSLYQRGRTPDLIKLKATREDQEALVLGVESDGALLLQLSDRSQIIVPKSRCLLHRRATRGEVVSFTFSNLRSMTDPNGHGEDKTHSHVATGSGGFYSPTVFRIRDDISWKDAENSSHTFEEAEANPTPKKQNGYWKDANNDNKRRHLEHFAKLHGFDPLVAENWYHFPRHNLEMHKEGRALLRLYPAGLVAALMHLLPEVSFDVSKFATSPRNYFTENTLNQRKLLENFARTKGEDALNPLFWYSVTARDYDSLKAMKTLISNYGTFKTAVGTIFPEIKFDAVKFRSFPSPTVTVGYWRVVTNRRALFCRIAREKGLDPLIAANWYSVTYHSLRRHKFACGILRRYYGGSLKRGLLDMFPDIGLEESKFASRHNFKVRRRKMMPGTQKYPKIRIDLEDVFPDLKSVPVGHWKSVENRRAVFIAVAQRQKFDPLVASNWYSVSHSSLRHLSIITSPVRVYYGGSLVEALLDLFPNIGLEKQKLRGIVI